jgi:5'-3' exonuclease
MKLCLSGAGQHFLLDDIQDGLKQQFQNMCIVAGCDYLHNVRGIGIRGAYNIISSSDDIFSTLENKGAPSNYKDHFDETKAVFSHQTVFDVDTLKTVCLYMWEINKNKTPLWKVSFIHFSMLCSPMWLQNWSIRGWSS